MIGRPETRYVDVGSAQVAYQVVGEGPIDIVDCYALGGHVDLFWQSRQQAEYLAQLATLGRVIIFDRRGSGASDPLPLAAIPTWEELAEDLTAVMDAAGSTSPSIVGTVDTGPIAILFAASHPERVRSLVLINTTARFMADENYPEGASSETVAAITELIADKWGTEEFACLVTPALAPDEEALSAVARMFRASATPRTAAAEYEYFMRHVDVRQVLPLVQVPTLVVHPTDSPLLPVAHGRYLARHIKGAKLIEVPGGDLTPGFDEDNNADVIEFLTGERPAIDIDRILTTVLFTDIVGSTERAAAVGDRHWKALLDDHDGIVRQHLRRFRGQEIKTTGDGFLASFDGPARAVRCASAISQATAAKGLPVRAGLHTGECEMRGDDLGGLSVHIAARIGALAGAHEVLVSGTVRDLVAGSGIQFQEQGEHDLKGVPGTWKLFAVKGSDQPRPG